MNGKTDKDELVRRGEEPVELPVTTVYGYTLILAGLERLQHSREVKIGVHDDLQGLAHYFERSVDQDTREASTDLYACMDRLGNEEIEFRGGRDGGEGHGE